MKQKYYQDRQVEIDHFLQHGVEEVLTEEMLTALPLSLKKHFRLCGFVGKPIAMNADVIWQESSLKLKLGQNWKALETKQFNSVSPIMRTSHMKVKKMLFAGKDYYKSGKGSMIGKILGLFTVVNATGKEVSQAALMTSFCEMMLLSGYAFQDYVEWKQVDENSVHAILRDGGFQVEGFFHFDEEGKFEYFESNDRFFDLGNGKFEKKMFRAKVNNYKTINGYYQPESVSVLWDLEDGEFEYFKGMISQIHYNVKQ